MRIFFRKVTGKSMFPAYKTGDTVLTTPVKELKTHQVVIAKLAGREVIKRIESITDDKRYYLIGDNRLESSDSREFGPVSKSDILGVVKIKFRFPVTVKPPKVTDKHIIYSGWGLAMFSSILVLLQLFRIDKIILEVGRMGFPGGERVDTLIYVLAVVAEIFSIPYLLRMKVSPLARVVSGFLVVFASWLWLIVHLWMIGDSASTLQLGNYINLPASIFTIALNIIWLGLSMWVVRMLGFRKSLEDLRKQFI
jgi:hypothetical protein